MFKFDTGEKIDNGGVFTYSFSIVDFIVIEGLIFLSYQAMNNMSLGW